MVEAYKQFPLSASPELSVLSILSVKYTWVPSASQCLWQERGSSTCSAHQALTSQVVGLCVLST